MTTKKFLEKIAEKLCRLCKNKKIELIIKINDLK